jgi:hypothetical protein
MKNITYTCDRCGRQKGETNHWFCFHLNSYGGIVLSVFKETSVVYQYACSEQCLMKAVSEWLSGLSK